MPPIFPPDLSWTSLIVIVVAVTIAYLVFGATGFGSAIVSVPTLAHILPLTFVVPLMTAVDCFAVATAMLRQWRHVDWHEFRRLFIPAVGGVALGSSLLVSLPHFIALALLGGFVIAFAVQTLLGGARRFRAIGTWWSIPAGLLGGVFSALFGTGGPLYMAYLASRIDDKTALRATSSLMIAAAVIMRAIVFAFTPLWSQAGMLAMIALLVPCTLIGYFAGSHLHLKLSAASIRRWIAWLLLVNGLLLILRATGGIG